MKEIFVGSMVSGTRKQYPGGRAAISGREGEGSGLGTDGSPRMNIDLHVYVLAELVEHGHQRVNGEAVKLYVANAAKVPMTDTGTEFSLARRRPFIVRMPMVWVARSALAYRPPGPEIRFIRSQALNPVTWSGLQTAPSRT